MSCVDFYCVTDFYWNILPFVHYERNAFLHESYRSSTIIFFTGLQPSIKSNLKFCVFFPHNGTKLSVFRALIQQTWRWSIRQSRLYWMVQLCVAAVPLLWLCYKMFRALCGVYYWPSNQVLLFLSTWQIGQIESFVVQGSRMYDTICNTFTREVSR